MQKNNKHLEEFVMVFPTKLLYKIGYFQGISIHIQKYLDLILEPNNHIFMKRKDAENNSSYKQIIPYVLLLFKDNVFTYRRGKLLAEKRLLGNYSIGFGGHISVHDPALFGTTYQDGLNREINEEVIINSTYTENITAVLNDDSNDVGRVHFGIVHIFSLEKPLVVAKEKSINEAKFLTMNELNNQIEKFENWSQICIQNLDLLIPF